ncbi:MAG: rhomboid family intramembrane serine protease [Pirellulales bacterium]
MGLYDREYYREEQPRGFSLAGAGNRTMVTNLVLVTVAIFVIDQFTPATGPGRRWLSDFLAVQADTLFHPWEWWRFITAGFVHDPSNVTHIGFNMLVLWMFGREVEMVYGRWELLRLYLTMLGLASVVWAITEVVQGNVNTFLVGASGAVTGVVILFALNFPRRTLLLFFVLPVPAWVAAIGMVLLDFFGAIRPGQVAHSAHLAGAAFAFVYYQAGWNLGRLVPRNFSLPRFKPRPKLRLHDPQPREEALSESVDRILEKISREGEGSLTKAERRTLEEASRRYQQRRQ